jgi:tetratricopeptide (TPR) repeat protein
VAFKLAYTDPKKKTLQKIEIILMVIILPIGLFYGAKTYKQWSDFKTAEAFAVEAAELTHVGRYDEGIPKLKQALEAYPPYYAVWEELGLSYHMLGDHQKEMESYLAATKVLPEHGNLFRELATAYHELGMHDKELEAAKKAVALPNTDPLFTRRVLERATKEASGETSTEVIERQHSHGHGMTPPSGQDTDDGDKNNPTSVGTPSPEQPATQSTPAAVESHEGHDHDHGDHADHEH